MTQQRSFTRMALRVFFQAAELQEVLDAVEQQQQICVSLLSV